MNDRVANGSRADGSPIHAPEWVDVAALLGARPRACRPYRAKTKGQSYRMRAHVSSAREDAAMLS